MSQRLDGADGTAYLVRPDQHICARWRNPDEATVRAALVRASSPMFQSRELTEHNKDLTKPQNPDDFYQSLIEAHKDFTDEQSVALNARIILLLSNHIGDTAVLEEALRLARQSLLQD